VGSGTVTIPEEEYQVLMRCRHIVESEFEEKFSKRFMEHVRESEEAYQRGDVVRVKGQRERRKLFGSL